MVRKHPTFQKNPIKDVGGVVDTSLNHVISQFIRAVIMSDIIESKIQYYMYILIFKTKGENLQNSEVFRKHCWMRWGHKMFNGHTDGQNDKQKDKGHFYSPLLIHRVTNRKNSYTAYNHLLNVLFCLFFLFLFLFLFFFMCVCVCVCVCVCFGVFFNMTQIFMM